MLIFRKIGQFKRECRFLKKLKTEGTSSQKKANVVESQTAGDIVAMIEGLKVSMITECNLTTKEFGDWSYDSGATVHVCINRYLFKNYEVATGNEKVQMGNHATANVTPR